MSKSTYRVEYYDNKELEIDADDVHVVNLEGGLFYTFYKMNGDNKEAFFQTPVGTPTGGGVRFVHNITIGGINVTELSD